MPFVALSTAPHPLHPEACKFVLVSETSSDNCRPLHIPIPDICRGPPKATTSVPRIGDQHKLVVGKCRPELYWAFERVPNTFCSWKHAAFWLDRDLEAELLPNAANPLSECAIHPSLPYSILRVQCLGAAPLLITRFSDHATVVVEPGQPQFLRAYDTLTFGPSDAPDQVATVRFLPLSQQPITAASDQPRRATVDNEIHDSTSMASASIASSLLQFSTKPNSRSFFSLPDAAVRRGGCITCTQVMSLILSDVVTNLTMIGVTSMPIVAHRPSIAGHHSNDTLEAAAVTAHPPQVMRPTASIDHIVIGDTPPQEKRPSSSHVSESDPDVPNSCVGSQTAHPAPQAASTIVASTPQQPSTSRAYSSVVRRLSTSSTVHPINPNVHSKRARSDSTTSVCSPSQARDVVPCPASRPTTKRVTDAVDDLFVMVPGSMQSLAKPRKAFASRGRDTSEEGYDRGGHSSSQSSSPSVHTAGSLPDSFDERWDEHLLALEAKSTAVRTIAAAPSPVKLFGGPQRTSQAVATTIGRHDSAEELSRHPPLQHSSSATHRHGRRQEDEVPPESQLVYFGHSQ